MKARLITFAISAILTAIIILLCSLSSGGWLYLLIITGHFLFLILAGLFLALRLAFFVSRQRFIYIFIGTFNLGLGLSSIMVFLFGYMIVSYPEMMSINLLVGLIMLVDALLLKRKPYEQSL